MKIGLNLKGVAEQASRENFELLENTFRGIRLLDGTFKFFEIAIPGAATHYRVRHNLGFTPKDIFQTSLVGSGTLTWNYELFDADYLDITTTAAMTVRAYVGKVQGEGVQA